ncbi:hypothetical protein [Acidisoma sp. 7E03]
MTAAWVSGLRWPVLAAAAASLLGLALHPMGVFDMPMAPAGASGLALAAADFAPVGRMAALMTLLGVLLPCPALLRSPQGLLRLAAWLLGLTLFGLLDMQAGMAAMMTSDTTLQTVLTYGPLFAGLAFACFLPGSHGLCVAAMLAMTHFGLMAWPWLGLCALLAAFSLGQAPSRAAAP